MPMMRDPEHAPANDSPADVSHPRPGPRFARLLQKLLDQGHFEEAQLARELVIEVRHLRAFRSGELTMPLERQAYLALLVVERVPALAREAHQLLAQVRAAAAYERGDTERHAQSPRLTWW